jgi:sulfonate transport system permease protein
MQLSATGELEKHIKASLERVAQGFVLGGTVGTLVGIWLGQSRAARLAIRPILELLRPIPGLAWAPLVLIWFGIGETGKIFLIAYATFFPVLTTTLDGVQGVPTHVVQAARSLGARPRQIFLRVLLPSALPNILTGLSIGMGQAFGILVAAELMAATEGMGWMISDARRFFRTDLVILGMVLIGVFGFICVQAIVLARRRLLRWYAPEAS